MLGGYEKGTPRLYRGLVDRFETAREHAERAMKDARETEEPNPSTEIHRLVALLRALKD